MSYFKQNAQTFNSNGSWVAPAGCSFVILTGYGGGGGGGGGSSAATQGGGGGGGSNVSTVMVPVTAGTSYTVTIGAGGTGGAAATNGNDGAATSFGSLATFVGASKGYNGGGAAPRYNAAGGPIPGCYTLFYTADLLATITSGSGGNTLQSGITPADNFVELGAAFTPATNGTTATTRQGGGGGGTGPGAAGGAGGNGNNGGVGVAGTAAAANSGAGGGGGGCGSTTGGAGAAGGSGKLIVAWIA